MQNGPQGVGGGLGEQLGGGDDFMRKIRGNDHPDTAKALHYLALALAEALIVYPLRQFVVQCLILRSKPSLFGGELGAAARAAGLEDPGGEVGGGAGGALHVAPTRRSGREPR